MFELLTLLSTMFLFAVMVYLILKPKPVRTNVLPFRREHSAAWLQKRHKAKVINLVRK